MDKEIIIGKSVVSDDLEIVFPEEMVKLLDITEDDQIDWVIYENNELILKLIKPDGSEYDIPIEFLDNQLNHC